MKKTSCILFKCSDEYKARVQNAAIDCGFVRKDGRANVTQFIEHKLDIDMNEEVTVDEYDNKTNTFTLSGRTGVRLINVSSDAAKKETLERKVIWVKFISAKQAVAAVGM